VLAVPALVFNRQKSICCAAGQHSGSSSANTDVAAIISINQIIGAQGSYGPAKSKYIIS
jgi:hypothetical protein